MHRVGIRYTLIGLACVLALHEQAGHALADTEPPRVILGPVAKDLVVGVGMNAAGRDLRGCEFVGQDLTGANFDGCHLYGVRFEDCILKQASFRGTLFAGARVAIGPYDLEGADFTDAIVNEVQHPSLADFLPLVLSPQQLMSTRSYKTKDLHQCVVNASWKQISFDFRGADLRQARLRGDLSRSDFTNARIHDTTFENFSLTFSQLASTSDYKKGSLRVRIMSGGTNATGLSGEWDFSGIRLLGSYLWVLQPNATFANAIIGDSTLNRYFTITQLYSTKSYREGYLAGVEFVWIDLSRCDLSGVNLTGCCFSHCRLGGVDFRDAVITDTTFIADKRIAKSDWLTVAQIKSTWNYRHGRMKGVRLPDDVREALKQEHENEL